MFPLDLGIVASSGIADDLYPLAYSSMNGSTSSVTFNPPTSGYRDLYIVIGNLAYTNGQSALTMQFNGDGGANYTYKYMQYQASSITAGGTSMAAGVVLGTVQNYQNGTYGVGGTVLITIPNYLQSVYYRPCMSKMLMYSTNGSVEYITATHAIHTNSFAAITSVSFIGAYNFQTNTTFSMYGVK